MFRTLAIGLVSSLLLSCPPALAAERGYMFSDVPDINGLLMKDGALFVSLGLSSTTGNAVNTFTKVIKLSPGGGKGCKAMKIAEIGVSWTTTSCVNVRKTGDSGYAIDVHSKFDFAGGKLTESDIEFLKQENFVRERKISIAMSYSAGSCSATVKSRSYKPLDGSAFKASRTGKIGCSAR